MTAARTSPLRRCRAAARTSSEEARRQDKSSTDFVKEAMDQAAMDPLCGCGSESFFCEHWYDKTAEAIQRAQYWAVVAMPCYREWWDDDPRQNCVSDLAHNPERWCPVCAAEARLAQQAPDDIESGE